MICDVLEVGEDNGITVEFRGSILSLSVETEPNKLIICQMFYPALGPCYLQVDKKIIRGFFADIRVETMPVRRNIFPTIGSKKRLKPWIIEGLLNWITPNFDRQLLLEKQQEKVQQKIILAV